MTKMTTLTTAIGLCVLMVSVTVYAKALKHDTKKSETSVSGFSGDKEFYSLKSTYGLTGIRWAENKDRACSFGRISRSLENVNADNVVGDRSGCSGGNEKKLSLGDGYYVNAISVCTNNTKETRKRRLKGIKVWGSRVKSDPLSVTRTSVTAKSQHTKCKNWHKKMSCPKGMIAYGFTTHDGDQGVYGMSLLCTNLIQKGMISRPKK